MYILSQLPLTDRPADHLMSQWAYTALKRHPLLRRVFDKYHDSPLGSASRTFDAIWSGVEKAILESQHDTNAHSIREDLRRGPPGAKARANARIRRLQREGKKGSGKGKDSKGKGGKERSPNPKRKPMARAIKARKPQRSKREAKATTLFQRKGQTV